MALLLSRRSRAGQRSPLRAARGPDWRPRGSRRALGPGVPRPPSRGEPGARPWPRDRGLDLGRLLTISKIQPQADLQPPRRKDLARLSELRRGHVGDVGAEVSGVEKVEPLEEQPHRHAARDPGAPPDASVPGEEIVSAPPVARLITR